MGTGDKQTVLDQGNYTEELEKSAKTAKKRSVKKTFM